jgi:hypothetical protein
MSSKASNANSLRVDDDPLAPARGVINAILISGSMWAFGYGIAWVLT